MKRIFSFLIVLGIASPLAMAQVQTLPQPTPGAEASSGSGTSDTSGTTGVPSSPSEASGTPDASGAPDTSGTSPEAPDTSGTSPGATDASGTSGPPSDASSGAADAAPSEAGIEIPPAPPLVERLKPVTQDDVTYLCGGVGQEEAQHMKKEAKGYDLMLTFATRRGDYLADVDVDIKDAKGNTVLQTACDSPILLVDLPRSGTYRVRAEAAGYTLNETVNVRGSERKGQRVASTVLNWPQRVAEAGEAATPATGTSGDTSGEEGAGSGDR